ARNDKSKGNLDQGGGNSPRQDATNHAAKNHSNEHYKDENYYFHILFLGEVVTKKIKVVNKKIKRTNPNDLGLYCYERLSLPYSLQWDLFAINKFCNNDWQSFVLNASIF